MIFATDIIMNKKLYTFKTQRGGDINEFVKEVCACMFFSFSLNESLRNCYSDPDFKG